LARIVFVCAVLNQKTTTRGLQNNNNTHQVVVDSPFFLRPLIRTLFGWAIKRGKNAKIHWFCGTIKRIWNA